jgi:hypothetical protein
MAKRPTLSLGKPRGKGERNRQLLGGTSVVNKARRGAEPKPTMATYANVNNPFGQQQSNNGITSSNQSWKTRQYHEARRNDLIEHDPDYALETASASGRLGFWADDDILSSLAGHTESVHSASYLQERTSSEQILAGRLIESGPEAAGAALTLSKQLSQYFGISHSGFANSTVPSEQLYYMLGEAGLNPIHFRQALAQADTNYGSPREEGSLERDWGDKMSSAQRRSYNAKKSPIDRALDVVGAMTLSREGYKQQLDAPDLITPDSGDKWVGRLREQSNHLGAIARAYIDSEAFEGGELSAGYSDMVGQVSGALNKLLPARLANIGLAQFQKDPTKGLGPGITQAFPSVSEVAKLIASSNSQFLVGRIDKAWTQNEDGTYTSPYAESFRELRQAYKDEGGGLSKARNTSSKELRYLQDELAAAGLADPSQTVKSLYGSEVKGNYEFEVTNDISEAIKSGMQMLSFTDADLQGDQVNNRSLLREVVMQSLQGGDTIEFEAAAMDDNIDQAIQRLINQRSDVTQVGVPLDTGVTTTVPTAVQYTPTPPRKATPKARRKVNPAASPVAPATGSVIQAAAEVKTEQRMAAAYGSPDAAMSAWLSQTGLTMGFSDDDKLEANSKWRRDRLGKITATSAGMLANPDTAEGAYANLIRDALTHDRPLPAQKPNIWQKSGDILEQHAVDWYRKNVDKEAFQPGTVTDPNRVGNAATLDAVSPNQGFRPVEVKSRNRFIDPDKLDLTTSQGQQDLKTYRKNWEQTQYQMWMTGQTQTDLVEILRDPVDPLQPLGRKGVNESNIRRRTIDRDEEYVNRNKGRWEEAGRVANQLANMDEDTRKKFAKAVEEGNIKSFEKLSQRYGVENSGMLAEQMGMPTPATGGGGRGGGGGGGRGNDFGYNALSGRDAPQGLGGVFRAAMAGAGPIGRAINLVTGVAGAAYNTADAVNSVGLNLSYQAGVAGVSRSSFQRQRDAISNQYYSREQASNDVMAMGRSAGGMTLGFTDNAVNMVVGSRGLMNFGDINSLSRGDITATQLRDRMMERGRARGYSDMQMSAIAEQTGLQTLVKTGASESQMTLNEGVNLVKTAIENLQTGVMTDIAGNIAEILMVLKGTEGAPAMEQVGFDVSGNKQAAKALRVMYSREGAEKSAFDVSGNSTAEAAYKAAYGGRAPSKWQSGYSAGMPIKVDVNLNANGVEVVTDAGDGRTTTRKPYNQGRGYH